MNDERNIPVEDKDSPFADETLTAEQQNYSDEQRAAREKAVSKHTIAEEVLDWLRTICIGVIAGVLIVVFVLQRDNVYGPSMMPTLNSGDVVFTQKISTYFSSYSRGDIVILNGQGMEGYTKTEYLVKRVIGLPGETVKIEDGNVYIKPADGYSYDELSDFESNLAGVKEDVLAGKYDSFYFIGVFDGARYDDRISSDMHFNEICEITGTDELAPLAGAETPRQYVSYPDRDAVSACIYYNSSLIKVDSLKQENPSIYGIAVFP